MIMSWASVGAGGNINVVFRMQQVRMRRRYSALLLLVGEAAADADAVLGVRPQDRQMAWPFPAGTGAKLDQLRARPDVPQERGRELAGAADRDCRAWEGLGVAATRRIQIFLHLLRPRLHRDPASVSLVAADWA